MELEALIELVLLAIAGGVGLLLAYLTRSLTAYLALKFSAQELNIAKETALMVVSTLLGNRSEIPKIFDKLNKKLLRSYNIEADPKTAALKNELLGGSGPGPAMWQNETLI